MHASRTLRRTLRPIWAAAAGATVWSNRARVRSVLGFGKKPGPTIHVTRRTDSEGHPVVRTVTTEVTRSSD